MPSSSNRRLSSLIVASRSAMMRSRSASSASSRSTSCAPARNVSPRIPTVRLGDLPDARRIRRPGDVATVRSDRKTGSRIDVR